jgi:signal transduction histidine kinase
MRNLPGAVRGLPLRSKLGLTMVAGGFLVLVVVAFFSFRYWHDQLVSTAREQALLSATTAQATLESALARGDAAAARATIERLRATGLVQLVRVYAPDGRVVLSSDVSEEGVAAPRGTWLPPADELPADGLARTVESGDVVHVFMRADVPAPSLLELRYSMTPLRAAVRRGMWMGVGLVLLGVLALAFVVGTMLEREIVAPLERMEGLLTGADAAPARAPARNEIQQLEASMVRLIRSRHEVEARAAERDRELHQREGFAQVGELAAEMAHELKRPLASIRSAMTLLEQEYVLDGRSRDVLDAMNRQLGLLSDTMRDLFSLARPVAIERGAVDACDVVDDALLGLAGHPALAGIDVVRDYGPALPPLYAEATRLQQAVQNVVLNAAEAMPDGGTITVSVRADSDHVSIAVRDDGVGMSEEAVEQALRPFHSTKAGGTGLGLPLVVRILAAHDGQLAIESEPGAGTTVWLTLPAAPRRGGAEIPTVDAWASAS